LKFRNFFGGYPLFCCSHCARTNKETLNKKQLTCLKKYGVKAFTNPEKAKQTCFIKYGDENYRNIDAYKNTCLEKYGVDNVQKVKEI